MPLLRPPATRLTKVWNRPAKPFAAAAGAQSRRCHPAELAADADIVCSCPSDTAAVEQVIPAADGLAAAFGSDTLVVIFQSHSPPESVRPARLRIPNAARR